MLQKGLDQFEKFEQVDQFEKFEQVDQLDQLAQNPPIFYAVGESVFSWIVCLCLFII